MKMSLLKFGLIIIIWSMCLQAAETNFSLYSDRRGKTVGDVITVLIAEDAKASNESGTSTQKENGVSASAEKGTGLLDFIPSFGMGGATSANFKGQGNTKREGTLKAKVTARIIEVLDNGNLMIKGSKIVEVNSEKEVIEVSGIIRQEDVGRDNTVSSFNIADAKITYAGNGQVYTGQRPGPIARFFNWIF